jgi:hypothetical protein
METFWKEFTPNIRAFNYDDEVIYLISTTNPHPNDMEYYIVVHDDAHKISTGKTEILSKNDIIEKYKILF